MENNNTSEVRQSLTGPTGKNPPLVVNFFAGPGAGKTTAAMEVTVALKKAGYNVEYVPEYAKELVYEKRLDLLNDQKHVSDEQYHRLDRIRGGVDMIVTDSPVLLGLVYGKDKIDDAYRAQIRAYYDSFDNFNMMMTREEGYQNFGRLETEVEAKEKDNEIRNMLKEQGVFFGTYKRDTIAVTVERIGKTFNRLYGAKQENAASEAESHPVFGTKKLASEAENVMALSNRLVLANCSLDTLKAEVAEREQGKRPEGELMGYAMEDLKAVIEDYEIYRSDEMKAYHKDLVNLMKTAVQQATSSTQAPAGTKAKKAAQSAPATRQATSAQTKWKKVQLDNDCVVKKYEKGTMFRMPQGSEYAGYIFFHPNKLVKDGTKTGDLLSDTSETCKDLVYSEEYKFNLKKDDMTVELTGGQLKAALQRAGKSAAERVEGSRYEQVMREEYPKDFETDFTSAVLDDIERGQNAKAKPAASNDKNTVVFAVDETRPTEGAAGFGHETPAASAAAPSQALLDSILDAPKQTAPKTAANVQAKTNNLVME